ncbi:MAG: hypothetical protein A2076_12165 [Geobacteraceae bacterium GWC2_53_11]|nr:MAG: hypothetical protein A2076_12165 [Geobacteraceae bacterium GWC2_53_11]
MKSAKNIISLLALLLLLLPVTAQAFWGNSDNQSGLNLETGYDINTVTTVTGRVVALHAGDDHRNAQCELESNGTHTVVVLGPSRYWAEHGIAIKTGDEVAVRGSKAQGKDGVVYFLAQKISDTSQNSSVSLRNESGRPAWAGKGMGNGGMTNRPGGRMRQQSHGRMGR